MTTKKSNLNETHKLIKAFNDYDDEMRNRFVSVDKLYMKINDLENENKLLRKYIEQYSDGPECDKCCHVLPLERFLKTGGATVCQECE